MKRDKRANTARHHLPPLSDHVGQKQRTVLMSKGREGLFSWGVEEDISSIYQMPEINPDIRHSALFLTNCAACR